MKHQGTIINPQSLECASRRTGSELQNGCRPDDNLAGLRDKLMRIKDLGGGTRCKGRGRAWAGNFHGGHVPPRGPRSGSTTEGESSVGGCGGRGSVAHGEHRASATGTQRERLSVRPRSRGRSARDGMSAVGERRVFDKFSSLQVSSCGTRGLLTSPRPMRPSTIYHNFAPPPRVTRPNQHPSASAQSHGPS